MRFCVFALSFALWGLWAALASAQSVFVQIEAHPTQAAAAEAAREYDQSLDDVKGFRFTTGWFVIALGPYELNQAVDVLSRLRGSGQIPGDSYLVDQGAYSNPFYPPAGGAQVAEPAAPEAEAPTAEAPAEATPAAEAAAEPPVEVAEPTPPPPPEETRREALRSEAELSREQKFELQTALQWFGFYTGAIDAAFGRGTRSSMAAWQESKGYEATGVLTTRQRGELVGAYNEVLASIGLRTITDNRAGITLQIPAALVQFDRHDPPFAHYDAIDDSGVRVLLISRAGDENSLIGLYDIMQTLKIVPLDGARERNANRFTLTGENSQIKSYTHAVLSGGEIKGFTLIWPNRPAGYDERIYDVVLNAMRDSFTPLPGIVLPDTLGDGALAQSVDLISGLAIRRPIKSLSGFFVNEAGAVLTTDSAVAGCARITLDETYEARVAASDAALGLALLRPETPLAPISFAQFSANPPRLNSEVALAGYSFGGILGAPTLTFGTLADTRGLDGDTSLKRLSLKASPSDAGGPVFDTTGAVLGILRPEAANSGQQLPEDVSFVSSAAAITEFLSANGLAATPSFRSTQMSPEDMTRQAADVTVLVSCWEE